MTDTSSDGAVGRLTEQELQHRWESQVEPRLRSQITPSSSPVLVLVGGQPGAGKTQAVNTIRTRANFHPAEQFFAVEGDSFRQFHPVYRTLLAHDPLAMPHVTAQAAGRWTARAIEYGYEQRASLLVEGTWRNASVPVSAIEQATGNGYRVHAVVLAVATEQSRLDTLGRYYSDRARGAEARWTPPEAHDQAVANLRATTELVVGLQEVDRVTVMTRAGEVVFDQEGWSPERAQSAGQALDQARGRAWSIEQARSWLGQYAALEQLHNTYTADQVDAVGVWAQLRTHDRPMVEQRLDQAVMIDEHRQLHGHNFPAGRAFGVSDRTTGTARPAPTTDPRPHEPGREL